jgi:hypothetical protein
MPSNQRFQPTPSLAALVRRGRTCALGCSKTGMNETDDRDDNLEEALETLRTRLEEQANSDFGEWVDVLDRRESPLEKLLLIDFEIAFGARPLEATGPPTVAGLIIDPEWADYIPSESPSSIRIEACLIAEMGRRRPRAAT